MSFIFGGVRGRTDPELEAANRRHRLRMARDINDVRTLNDPDVGAPRRKRGRHWLLLAIVAAVLGVLGFVGGRGEDVPITASCATPDIAVASSQVEAGQPLQYRLTGPDDVRYVVTVDGGPVQGDAGGTLSYTQTSAGPALELEQCVSPTLVVAAPAGDGPHELALLQLADDGSAQQVAALTLTVSVTR
jgi:hypothetical protein